MTAQTAAIPDIPARVRSAVTAALDKKAIDLRVLHLSAVTSFTDYFVICSGTSQRQAQAIGDGVEERLRGEGVRPLGVEGQASKGGTAPGQWVLLDYGDFLVHVFTDDRRRFYDLERLWSDAPDVTAEFGG
jgi:ribosome-associated protein